MADPLKKRNWALLFLGLAVAAVVAAVSVPDGGRGFTFRTALLLAGAAVAPFALGGAIFAQIHAARFQRMRRGEGVLARWTVTLAEWRAFVEACKRYEQEKDSVPNRLSLRNEPSSGGVEVIVSDNALSVGGEFHGIGKDVFVSVHPSFMDFRHHLSDGEGPTVHTLVRIPLPAHARADAERIRARYASVRSAAAANSRAKLWIALGFALFIAGFVAWGVLSETLFRR